MNVYKKDDKIVFEIEFDKTLKITREMTIEEAKAFLRKFKAEITKG